ncbi:MAG: S46 family peptidase [Prevotella sp.]|nr:S46 family peptidase [Prevotella sp.]
MKRILSALLPLYLLAVPMTVSADEGMWTLYNLPQAVYEQMKAEGFAMPYENLYSSENAIKNCVVNFSGYCSGVVVSPNGLVFTNHHCGFESIRSHSTVEHDYMLNGFCAKSYEEELPNKNMFVSFMREQKDITEQLENLAKGNKVYDDDWTLLIDSLQQAMNDSIRKIDKTLHIEIDPFYEGNAYFATTYQTFHDLRLVFAIPKSMGKFGGETDNWMWPRQTCDFSVFRIYADPQTNGPAEYSDKNVPYHPTSWASVSMQGYKDGDFSMTIGYPGSTNRYLSSYGIREMRDAENATRVQVRGIKQEIMKRHMNASEAVRIKYDSKYAQSSNYWKNSMGMNKCIDSIGIIRQKQEHEARIRIFQEETGYLKDELDFEKLEKLYSNRFESDRAFMYWVETFNRTNELVTRAMRVNTGGFELKGPQDKEKKQYFEIPDNSEEWDEALDKEVFAALLKNYKEQVDAKYLPAFYQTIEKKFRNDYTKYVDYLYKKSLLMKGKKIYPAKKSYLKDPGVQLGLDLTAALSEIRADLHPFVEQVEQQEKYLCAAKLRMEADMPHYSDANFTMRLSYGQVGEYLLDGKPSGYYTTAESIVEKMKRADEIEEYYAEPIMHELLSAKDFTPYTDKTTGKMQLCFLTNNDITGGNSGSPMFNGKGELIGLAFDGNWDSLSSDINFDRVLARCIGVDIRYVLFMMDRWGHADRLLKEINAR